jgi:putative transposase
VAGAIVSILKQQEAGIPTKEICRQHGISEATFYNWKSRYGGMEASDVKRLRDLEEENSRLKKRPPLRMFADLSLDNQILKEIFAKKGWALRQKGN